MISLNLCQCYIIFCTPNLMATKQIARPSASKTCIYVFTDNNTVTYNITRNSKGGLFCCAVQQTLFILCAILNSSALYLLSRKVQEKKQQQELTDNTGEPDCVQDILLHQHAEGELAGLVVGLGCPVSCGGHPARAKDDDQSALKN